jgi:DNA-binding beta-propeller fold protein YncE
MRALALRLIVGLALLGCPRMGSAQGTWSVISLPQQPGDVAYPNAVAVDGADNLYVADHPGWPYGYDRLQRRDAQGNWSVIATSGSGLGQVSWPSGLGAALAADAVGNLYVADRPAPDYTGRIQKRDAQGNWSLIATRGTALGQVSWPTSLGGALAADAVGNLYVADFDSGARLGRIQKRDAQGNWSLIATYSAAPGQGIYPAVLAVDIAGNLFVADRGQQRDRIQKRDAQGNWSLIATYGLVPGQVSGPTELAVDTAGNLYVADSSSDVYGNVFFSQTRIQKRDAQGNWSVIATSGSGLGQVSSPGALAVDTAGNLYVAESERNRIQKRDAQGNWSVIATPGYPGTALQNLGGLAVDAAGNLYIADIPYGPGGGRIQKRDALGNWSVLATSGPGYALGQVSRPAALAVDPAGNLYVAESSDLFFGGVTRIQKRDAQGNWSLIAGWDLGLGEVSGPTALVVDAAGNLYVAEDDLFYDNSSIQKRDAQGNWSVVADLGAALGQVDRPAGLAVDTAGKLYVAETGNRRVQQYTPHR